MPVLSYFEWYNLITMIMAINKPISLSAKVDRLDSRFTNLESRFDGMESRFEAMESGFEAMESRFGRLESKFDEFIDFVGAQFANVDSRLDNLDKGQDFLLKEVRELRIENTVGAHRSHRMEKWIIRASKKINVPYQP